jgi:hypothetical protein
MSPDSRRHSRKTRKNEVTAANITPRSWPVTPSWYSVKLSL